MQAQAWLRSQHGKAWAEMLGYRPNMLQNWIDAGCIHPGLPLQSAVRLVMVNTKRMSQVVNNQINRIQATV
jgi:hypothetical protein